MPTLDFKGKQFIYSHHHSVPFRELVVDDEKSLPAKGKAPNIDDNLIINGDNLHALKALMPLYAGKVKCIYIDPPYNTGNEGWCYNDNVNSPLMKEWLLKNANPVDKEDLQRHDKWLCMMYPRLKLLHELLADDGVIFVSIDDNEQHHLRAVMDEIFGEGNFVQNIIWQKKYSPQNDAKYFSDMHDFIICYAKNKIDGEQKFGWERNLLERTNEMNDRYSNPDNDPRGDWKSSDFSVKTYSENYDYLIVTPAGREVKPPQGRCWRTSKENYKKLLEENRVWFGVDGKSIPSIKRFLTEVKQGVVPVSIWNYEEVGHNQEARQELKTIFADRDFPFETPKPVRLINKILKLATDKSSIILDSFAGSGTTAHAVLDLNKEDGGNRKFILVEMESYADNITAERVRRVIKGVPTAKDEKLKNGLGGSFTFCKLGDEFNIEKILTGETLPKYEALANYVFYTATGKSLETPAKQKTDYFVGETDLYEVYLIYQPDIAFLRSNESALNAKMVEIISQRSASKKQKLVFASAKYMGQNELSDHKIIFCQLPYAIHKITAK